jgi:hypothetical protein
MKSLFWKIRAYATLSGTLFRSDLQNGFRDFICDTQHIGIYHAHMSTIMSDIRTAIRFVIATPLSFIMLRTEWLQQVIFS